MRFWLCVVGLVAVAGCGRKFVEPQGGPEAPLAVDTPAFALAPNQVVSFHVSGGKAPYRVETLFPSEGNCGVIGVEDGAVTYDACFRPLVVQDVVTITDAAGAQVSVIMQMGRPVQASGPDPAPASCQVSSFTVSGGLPGYHLVVVDGTPGTCPDGGPGFTQLADPSDDKVSFLVPPWSADGGNTYTIYVEDSVAFGSGSAEAGSFVAFTVTVPQPPRARAPLQPAQPWLTVQPGQSVQLGYTPAEAPVKFSMPFDGNSSNGSITDDGLYTAGLNPDTIDHVRIEATDDASQIADVYILVGNPQIAIPLTFGSLVRSGDFNRDGFRDLVMLSDGTTSQQATEILGGPVLPEIHGSFSIPSSSSGNHAHTIEPLDVNGDGLTDLLAVQQGGGSSTPIPACAITPSPACTTDGTDPSQNSQYCSDLASCTARLYASDGSTTQVPCSSNDNGAHLTCSAGGGGLTCSLLPFTGGPGYSYECDQGCAAVATGRLCVNSWGCGPEGCAPNNAHQYCNGSSCTLTAIDANGVRSQPSCTEDVDAGIFQCGPFTCRLDGRGGYDCGERDCVRTATGLLCNLNACQVPDGGPVWDCVDFNGATQCSLCADVGYAPSVAGVEILRAQLDGTFADVGAMPWAREAIPAQLDRTTLLVPGNTELTVSAPQGTLEFARRLSQTHQMDLPTQNSQAVELAAPRDGNAKPWGAFAAANTQLPDGGQIVAVYGESSLAALSMPVASFARMQDSRGRVLAQASFAPGAAESLVVVDYADGKLLFVDPMGSETTFPVPLGRGERIDEVIAVPGLRAVAVSISAQQNALGSRFVLVGEQDGVATELDWAEHRLPQLTDAGVAGIAAGDFNGDGLDDLAVLERETLTLYPGQVGGLYARGEQYAEPLPVGSLSAATLPDGGRFLSAAGLDGNVHLYALIDRQTDAGDVSSSLAYAGVVTPAGATTTLGAIIRGGQLWVLASTAELDVYPSFAEPSDFSATAIQGVDPAMSPVLGFALIPDASDAVAAWALFASADGADIAAVHLHGMPDGSVHADPPLTATGLVSPGGFVADGADLVFTSVNPSGPGYILWRSTPAVFGGITMANTVASGFQFGCDRSDFAAPVPGTQLVLFDAEAGDGGCNGHEDEMQLYVYDYGSGASNAVPIAGAGAFRMDQLALAHFADGGVEILGVGKNNPGVFGVLPDSNGGWKVDPELLANIATLGILDLQDGRFALPQLQPPSIRILRR